MPVPVLMTYMTKRSCYLWFSCLEIRNVMLSLMPLVSFDANVVTWHKHHIAPHFDHFDLWKSMMPLMMPSLSCDADASTSGITWPKMLQLFKSSWPQECNDAIGICYTITGTSGITWPKKSCCPSFQLSCHKEWKAAIDFDFGIIWYQCCHMTKSYIAPHFDHIDVRNARVPLAWHDADASTNSVKWLKNHLHLTLIIFNLNAVVVLMIPLCDANIDITWPKSHVPHCFNILTWQQMVPLNVPSVSYDASTGAKSIKWPKESCDTLFQLSSHNKKWCHWWCS